MQLQDLSLSSWKDHGSHMREKNLNVTAIFKKGKEKDPRNYWPINLTSVPRKIMDYVFLEAIFKHMKDRKVTENSQHGCTMGRLCLTSLTTFCGEMTSSVDEGSTVDVVYLDCSMALHSLP